MKRNVFYFLLLSIICLCSCESNDNTISTLKAVPFEEQLDIDILAIEAYLNSNSIVTETHNSGIRFVTTEEGQGPNPSNNNMVKVKYKGQLLDGTVFDENSDGVSFVLEGLIVAWQLMIPEMKEGGKMTIYAPSVYCYGFNGRGSIPSNANLIFDIELISVQ